MAASTSARRDAFTAWIARAQEAGPSLDEVAYRALLEQSVVTVPYTYRDATSDLFGGIASGKLPAGPGPGPRVAHLETSTQRAPDASR